MVKNRSDRIQVVIDLSKIELNNSEVVLQSIKSQLQVEGNQLNSLQNYKDEYLEQLKSSKATTLQSLNSMHAFVSKLNQAIEFQRAQIINLEETFEQSQGIWVEKKVRTQSLENLYKKIKKKENIKVAKEEQKIMDDMVASNFVRR